MVRSRIKMQRIRNSGLNDKVRERVGADAEQAAADGGGGDLRTEQGQTGGQGLQGTI